MSSQETHAAIINLADADRVASMRPHDDINSPVASCPASQAQVFVGARTLCTCGGGEPRMMPASPALHRRATRWLLVDSRSGFLYVWQRRGPLQRYAVSAQSLLEPQSPADSDDLFSRPAPFRG